MKTCFAVAHTYQYKQSAYNAPAEGTMCGVQSALIQADNLSIPTRTVNRLSDPDWSVGRTGCTRAFWMTPVRRSRESGADKG